MTIVLLLNIWTAIMLTAVVVIKVVRLVRKDRNGQ